MDNLPRYNPSTNYKLGAGPPGRRPRRRRRRGPRDPRTPHPAAAPPSSGAAAEGSPAATTHRPVTSSVERRTSRPAPSSARSPPPAGGEPAAGARPAWSTARRPRGACPRLRSGWLRPCASVAAPARWCGDSQRGLSPWPAPPLAPCSRLRAPAPLTRTRTVILQRLRESSAPRLRAGLPKGVPWGVRMPSGEQGVATAHSEPVARRLQAKSHLPLNLWISFQNFFSKGL
nr:atherin-like [Equus asinus]